MTPEKEDNSGIVMSLARFFLGQYLKPTDKKLSIDTSHDFFIFPDAETKKPDFHPDHVNQPA